MPLTSILEFFSRKRQPTLAEVKRELIKKESDKTRARLDFERKMRAKEERQKRALDIAKKGGLEEDLRDAYEEIKLSTAALGDAQRQYNTIRKEHAFLRRTESILGRAERTKDADGLKKLMARMEDPKVRDGLIDEDVSYEMYSQRLDSLLSIDTSVVSEQTDDPAFEDFKKGIMEAAALDNEGADLDEVMARVSEASEMVRE